MEMTSIKRNSSGGVVLDGNHVDRGAGQAARRTALETANPVQSLSRALDLLECIAAAESGIGLTELAQAAGLPTSTTHRLLKSLEQRRYAVHDEERNRWFIGVQAFTVGGAFLRGRNYLVLARPFMRLLMEEAGETVNLAIEDQGEAVFLAQIECRQMMRAFSLPGARAPLHCSGVGKALLATFDEQRTARLLTGEVLARLTDKTITTRPALDAELAATRSRGYAIDDEEHAVGLRCVAATIHDEHGAPLAALSISGPTARIPNDRIDELGRLVARYAREVTDAVGGKVPND
jgi:IclR family acetate operon transcriptional repressor